MSTIHSDSLISKNAFSPPWFCRCRLHTLCDVRRRYEVFIGALARMVGPRAGVGEGAERLIEGD